MSRSIDPGAAQGIIAMKSQYLVAVLFAVCGLAIGFGAHSANRGGEYCPNPSAASVTALFAPCQTFDTAMGNEVSKQEAVQMGLLTPDLQAGAATQLAQDRKPDSYLR